MTHTFIVRKSNGLVCDEFYDEYVYAIESRQIDSEHNQEPCYAFNFRSGNSLYYPVRDYRVEYRSGYAM